MPEQEPGTDPRRENRGASPWSGFSYIATNLARFIRPGEVTFSGVNSTLPMLACLLAKRAYDFDFVYINVAGGVQPTPKAQRLADPVRQALATIEQALGETAGFDPARSERTFQIHMSDIGEGRFLHAPSRGKNVRVASSTLLLR